METKQHIVKRIETINHEIDEMIDHKYKLLALNSRYQRLVNELRDLLAQLKKVKGQ